jgi:hypothetical protein
VDDALFDAPTSSREGARLEDLSVQVSTYGKPVPTVYGTARLAGNLIWSRPIQETATTTTSRSGGGKGGGGRGGARTETTTYSYSVSLAVGICEGPVDRLLRIWADAKLLDLAQVNVRFYRGDEGQMPDSFIESMEGAGSAPAYRGLAYVVLENFPLADFGNRIPNFTFEIKRKMLSPDVGNMAVEHQVRSMVMIPGAGEFVYDTSIQQKLEGEVAGSGWAQSGLARPLNRHTPSAQANALVALDDLADTCPQVEWISVVVTWFGTSLDAGACEVLPAVEYTVGAEAQPEPWSVAGYTRANARLITQENGRPRYGGTPDDQSLLRYLTALKARGYKVMLLPMFFMDLPAKPWRGHVTGSPSDVSNFFVKTNGYNSFIMHYANLCAGLVDAFAIGSELVGLTRVMASAGVFPAVGQLVALAGAVRGVLGAGVTLTYAADWSEYHHTDGGWYHLDPLWASPSIDVIGIDAYFPLTDEPQSSLTLAKVMAGWTSGEGYDWYYSDPARQVRLPLAPAYAWKNINWFWSNPHVNPDSSVTAWVPQSKKIWFTEYGFPSVDGATNQPNVFYDPGSSESHFPRFSRGQADTRAQRLGIAATEEVWKNSPMVERRFLWTWDARPYPYFPDLRNVWADGGVWLTGHWVSGKLGLSSLGAIVEALCVKAGLPTARIDITRLTQRVEGFIIPRQATARQLIEELMAAYFFDAVESDGVLRFIPRGEGSEVLIEEGALVSAPDGTDRVMHSRQPELDLPQRVQVLYLRRSALYQTGTQSAIRPTAPGHGVETLSVPLVMNDAEAKEIAEVHLQRRWVARQQVQCELDRRYAGVEPTDILLLNHQGNSYRLRVTRALWQQGRLRVDATTDDPALYRAYAPPIDEPGTGVVSPAIPASRLELLDLPALPGDGAEDLRLRWAAGGIADGWRGAVLYRSDDDGANYQRLGMLERGSVVGTVVSALPGFSGGNRFDLSSVCVVRLLGEGALQSVSRSALLNGANAALIGEEIVQFQEAVELAAGKYELRGLLRARLGSESAMASHAVGERFVLLEPDLGVVEMASETLGLIRQYKAVSVGATLAETPAQSFAMRGRSLHPLSPVHLRGVRDISGQLAISWVRRARVDQGWRDAVDVPLDEPVERYVMEVRAAGNTLRRVTVDAPSYLYSAAMQIADFGSLPAGVEIRVAQWSPRVGLGAWQQALL